jgi:hypothetical protein
MTQDNPVFEQTYQHYLRQLGPLDLPAIADRLRLDHKNGFLYIPFFNRIYGASPEGILDSSGKRAPFDVSVVLFKYLIMCPPQVPADCSWASYKDFKDAAPLVSTFSNRAEGVVTRHFTDRLEVLESACRQMQAHIPEIDLSYSLARQFQALPTIPLLLLFNDAEEGFPAQCSILFERRVEHYLDMESLAILGMLFAGYLKTVAYQNLT